MTFFSYQKLEFFFSNFSFLCLFLAMLAFWFSLAGKMSQPRTEKSFQNDLALQTAGTSFPPSEQIQKNEVSPFATSGSLTIQNQPAVGKTVKSKNWGEIGILTSNLSLFGLLSLRWLESGHFPLSNLYESLMFLSWALTFIHLTLKFFTNRSDASTDLFTVSTTSLNASENSKQTDLSWLGAITAPTALFTTAFANFSLPVEMQRSSALVPALQSNWLMMHVTVMILSYAALIFGCLLSIGFLILTFSYSSEDYEQKVSTKALKPLSVKLQWAENLDNLSYRMLGLGFPLLTIGILSGAVWANEAWGSYWSWDPKETWALLTWLIFAIYLHTRITKNWQGKKPAMIAAFGFFVVWVCYLGVNLLGEGLHSYGWLKG